MDHRRSVSRGEPRSAHDAHTIGGGNEFALARYNIDGTLDPSFDGDGILTADSHGRGEFGQDVVIQPDAKIVAAGYAGNGTDTEFALMRANP